MIKIKDIDMEIKRELEILNNTYINKVHFMFSYLGTLSLNSVYPSEKNNVSILYYNEIPNSNGKKFIIANIYEHERECSSIILAIYHNSTISYIGTFNEDVMIETSGIQRTEFHSYMYQKCLELIDDIQRTDMISFDKYLETGLEKLFGCTNTLEVHNRVVGYFTDMQGIMYRIILNIGSYSESVLTLKTQVYKYKDSIMLSKDKTYIHTDAIKNHEFLINDLKSRIYAQLDSAGMADLALNSNTYVKGHFDSFHQHYNGGNTNEQ